MKLAILQNSDVIEKNGCQIRTQRPKISKDLLVPSNAQVFVALCYDCILTFFYSKVVAIFGSEFSRLQYSIFQNFNRKQTHGAMVIPVKIHKND